MTLILLAYNNCGSKFESNSLIANNSESLSESKFISDSFSFSLKDSNKNTIWFKGSLQSFYVNLPNDNSLNTPTVLVNGFLCSSSLSNIEVIVSRKFETNTSSLLNEPSKKYYLTSDKIPLNNQSSELAITNCGNTFSSFSFNSQVPELQIDNSMLTDDEVYIHNDYFYIEVAHSDLQQPDAEMSFANQLPGKIEFIDPYLIREPANQNELGAWSAWQEQRVSECNRGQQTYELNRTCSDGLDCRTESGNLAKIETKNENRSCTPEPPLGTWGNWQEQKIGSCSDNGEQTYELTRTCSNGLDCRTESGDLAKTETKSENRSCTPPNNDTYNPPDEVNGINTPRNKTFWSDSYSVDGQCYCDTTNFDHGLKDMSANTPNGRKKITEICKDVENKFGKGRSSGRVYFNDIQCGHGPANDAADEKICPGIPNGNKYSGSRCKEKGSTWNLNQVYN